MNLSHPNIECPVKCIFFSLLCNILSVVVLWKSSYFAQLWCLSLFSENGEGLVTGKFNSWYILFALLGFTVLVFRSELNSISIPVTFDRPHLDVWFKKVIVHVQLQNTGPLISISFNNKSCYCYLPRSTKDSNQFAYAGPEWPCIL